MSPVTRLYEADDSSQVLVTIWDDGTLHVATRPDHFESTVWGPPLTLVRTETSREPRAELYAEQIRKALFGAVATGDTVAFKGGYPLVTSTKGGFDVTLPEGEESA